MSFTLCTLRLDQYVNSFHSNKKLVQDGKFSELNWLNEDGQSKSQL